LSGNGRTIQTALDDLPEGEARRWCVDAQRILVGKYLPDLLEPGDE